ncbi:membrane protein insertion efficiency factor YidD [Bifidobacterium magnum]|uniref:membrane protein insertion efficiency factor YidD n=1 Tax=Bifidobacterium magnum TaxID=1692 RepID=UPI0009DBFDD1|nr:membrane protein insertion efficiency factor YidD [Bifidobacterium magnum]
MTAPARVAIDMIRWYQRHISAGRPACCKYYPSCSNYAIEAVRRFGAWRGSILALLRVLRCRPWSLGGVDDVPQHFSVLYRFSWSKAHEEPRYTSLVAPDEGEDVTP